MIGLDLVISWPGVYEQKPATVYPEGAQNSADAMLQVGVDRFFVLR